MTAPELKTLDPAKVTLSVDGMVVTGFAAGEYIRATLKEPQYEQHVGVHGHAIRVRRHGRAGEIRFRLLPTSPILPKLRALEEQEGTFEVVCTDSNDGAEKGFTAPVAWIPKGHDFVRAKDGPGNEVEVTIETHHLIFEA